MIVVVVDHTRRGYNIILYIVIVYNILCIICGRRKIKIIREVPTYDTRDDRRIVTAKKNNLKVLDGYKFIIIGKRLLYYYTK